MIDIVLPAGPGDAMTAELWVELAKAGVDLVVGLAWPAAIAVVLYIFRNTIAEKIGKMARFKYGDLEFDLRDELVAREPDEATLAKTAIAEPATGNDNTERQRHLKKLALDALQREFPQKFIVDASHRERADLFFDGAAFPNNHGVVFEIFVLGESTDLPISSFEALETRASALAHALGVDRDAITLVIACVTSLTGEQYYELEGRARKYFRSRRYSDVRIFSASWLEDLAQDRTSGESEKATATQEAPTNP